VFHIVLQCVIVCNSVLQCFAVYCGGGVLQCIAAALLNTTSVCCSVLQYVVVGNSVVTFGAVWCSVL